MKIIKINSSQNRHIPYTMNRAVDLMKQYKCGGISKTGEGIAEINPWSEKVAEAIKDSLNKMKMIFTEEGR